MKFEYCPICSEKTSIDSYSGNRYCLDCEWVENLTSGDDSAMVDNRDDQAILSRSLVLVG